MNQGGRPRARLERRGQAFTTAYDGTDLDAASLFVGLTG